MFSLPRQVVVLLCLLTTPCTFISDSFGQGDLEDRVAKLEAELADSNGGMPKHGLWGLWKNGLRLESPDGQFKFKIGGRIQNDWALFDQNRKSKNVENFQDGTEFRRARIRLQATIYQRFIAKFQYDMEGGDADFKDVYMGITGIKWVGTFTVGHQFEPFGLEQMTSSLNITFIERALPVVFVPGRNTGFRIQNNCTEGRVTYSFGIFRESDSTAESTSDGDYNLVARVTGLPLYEDNGRKLVHVGVAYSYRNNDGRQMWSFASRPEVHLASNVVDTGDFMTKGVQLFGGEVSCVFGPFSAQAEYYHADAESVPNSNGQFYGHYVQVSYFLTGESRAYDKKGGRFTRVKPKHNLFSEEGCGAWEVALRHSCLDLNSGAIRGGTISNVTAGVNWYMNPNTKAMLNLVHTDLEGGRIVNSAVWRFQFDF